LGRGVEVAAADVGERGITEIERVDRPGLDVDPID